MIFFVTLFVDGALAGALYSLIALAFVVTYKAARMINFALGEWLMRAGVAPGRPSRQAEAWEARGRDGADVA